MKRLVIALGFLSMVTFGVYYQYAYNHWPNVPQVYYNLVNWVLYITMSFCFFMLGKKEEPKERFLVFYPIAQFWFFLTLTYVLNEVFNNQIVMHKVLISISLSFIVSICTYLLYLRK